MVVLKCYKCKNMRTDFREKIMESKLHSESKANKNDVILFLTYILVFYSIWTFGFTKVYSSVYGVIYIYFSG